ncbi:hypothetical protein [Shewanella nanhaiensis]|uniref:Uncharacterized protein n=1 Tax=Shewanella nanhaiensis TaxID=2864872 RepID=A0ABS7E2V0_9GAMM|nr:hypothetical protein [Shewanella nanhaiensis]MBW8183989.1 hypothetical protein [Shewanella nanhaiensis]
MFSLILTKAINLHLSVSSDKLTKNRRAIWNIILFQINELLEVNGVSYTVWQSIIILISFGMVLLSTFCIHSPQKLIDWMPLLIKSKLARYTDLSIRLLLGISLILSAETTTFPAIFLVLGCLSLTAVLIIMIASTHKLEALIKYLTVLLPIWAVRLVCLFSVFLFAFMIFNIG